MNDFKKIKKCEFYVEGMHCAACELLIEDQLSNIEGIKNVKAELNRGAVSFESERQIEVGELNKLVEEFGYKIFKNKETPNHKSKKDLLIGFLIAVIFFGLFLFLQKSRIINLTPGNGQITLPFVFLIGVVASLSSCMAVVGGLVLSLSSNYAKEKQASSMISFHASRIISFFILGGLIGLIGSAFVLSPVMSSFLNLVLFIVMIVMAINLMGISTLASRLQFRIPKVVGKKILNFRITNKLTTPMLLGAVTFFLPCGFTQSMQLYSLKTGNFFAGAMSMLVFALGTFPVLALISFTSTRFSKGFKSELFFKTAGFIIILFAIFNFTNALVAIGLIDPLFSI